MTLSRSAASASGVSMSTSTLSLSISTSAHQLGMLADQVLGADIAGQFGHLGDEALGPQHRVAALAAAGRHDDGAALQRVEGGDQP